MELKINYNTCILTPSVSIFLCPLPAIGLWSCDPSVPSWPWHICYWSRHFHMIRKAQYCLYQSNTILCVQHAQSIKFKIAEFKEFEEMLITVEKKVMVIVFLSTVLQIKRCISDCLKAPSHWISGHTDGNAISILLFKISHTGSSPNTGIDDNLLAGQRVTAKGLTLID